MLGWVDKNMENEVRAIVRKNKELRDQDKVVSEICVLKRSDHMLRDACSELYVALKCHFLSIELLATTWQNERTTLNLIFLPLERCISSS